MHLSFCEIFFMVSTKHGLLAPLQIQRGKREGRENSEALLVQTGGERRESSEWMEQDVLVPGRAPLSQPPCATRPHAEGLMRREMRTSEGGAAFFKKPRYRALLTCRGPPLLLLGHQ